MNKQLMHWVDWAVENEHVLISTLLEIMLKNKVAKKDALSVLQMASVPYVLHLARKHQAKYDKICSVLDVQQMLHEQDPEYQTIKKIDPPSEEEFFKCYWLQARPVVIKNLGQTWDTKKWSFDYLLEKFGNEMVSVQTNRNKDVEYEINSVNHRENMLLREFINKIKDKETNDIYMTANNHAFKDTKLKTLFDDVGELPSYLTKEKTGVWHLWVGAKGTITPLHHDENALLHIQIKGRKHWKFISPCFTHKVYNHKSVFSEVDIFNPDYNKYPLLKDVKVLETTVEEGETMFLPIGWWHAVESLEPSISISMVNFTHKNANWPFKNSNA